MQFSIDVSGAAIAKPSRCVSGSTVANLDTSLFVLQAGATEPVRAHAIAQWQCDKAQLITSVGP
jgi:hypothetical protein